MSLAILRAMIAAAKADGHIDAVEQQKIFGKLDAMDLGTEDKAFVIDELRKPLDIDAVVAAATTPELAVEIYAASLPCHRSRRSGRTGLSRHAGLAPQARSRLARQHRSGSRQGHGLSGAVRLLSADDRPRQQRRARPSAPWHARVSTGCLPTRPFRSPATLPSAPCSRCFRS